MSTDPADDFHPQASVLNARSAIIEMRDDLKTVGRDVNQIKVEQARVSEHLRGQEKTSESRVDRMLGVQSGIENRLKAHDEDIDDLKEFKSEAVGVVRLARYVLGASLLATIGMAVDIILQLQNAGHPAS